MNNMLLVSDGVIGGLIITLIVFAIVVGIAWLIAVVMRWQVLFTYRKFNKIQTQQNIDAKTNCEFLLNSKGLSNVKVEKCGFWRSLLGFNMQGYGNSYSSRKKTIYLRNNIMDKATITSIGVGSQRVGHAVLDKEQDKKFKLLSILRPFYNLAPLFLLPIILIGGLLEVFLFKSEGAGFAIVSIIGFVYLIGSFVCMLITIPVEKRANKIALDALKSSGLYTEEEIAGMEIVLNAYIKSYIADFIYAVIELIWEVLKLVTKIAVKAKK